LQSIVSDRLSRVIERIDKAARRAGRNPQDITLVAVTKTIPFDAVQPLLLAGIRNVGENRVQEALGKYAKPDGGKQVDATVHLIGQLQSNKARKAVALFDMIQSIDRLDLAEDVNRHAAAMGKSMPCLVEVKISPEATKSGIEPERLPELLAQMAALKSLAVRGLMGIAPLGGTAAEARPFFARLRRLAEQARLPVLSMGMSGDFEAAIEEGATMVRVGAALFGPRV